MRSVAVVGSVNIDQVASVTRLPRPGETVLARDKQAGLGGKGANQAVAAKSANVDSYLIARVGPDVEGSRAQKELAKLGVNLSHLAIDSSEPTGSAFVFVDQDGENSIVVTAGANAMLTPEAVRNSISEVMPRIVLCQAEIPPACIAAAAETSVQVGSRFVLNLAPTTVLPASVVKVADPLIVNQIEGWTLAAAPSDEDPYRLAKALGRLARSVVLTLGSQGAIAYHSGEATFIGPQPVGEVVDTTGAGDAFCGVLAACLARGDSLIAAARNGAAAGALAVTQHGAQLTIPDSQGSQRLEEFPLNEERRGSSHVR